MSKPSPVAGVPPPAVPVMPSGSVAYRRSRSTRNCSVSNSWWMFSRSQGTGTRSRGAASSATSRASSVSCRLRSTSPRCSRSLSPALPLTSSTRSTSAASEPNSVIQRDAVFSPTPGMRRQVVAGVAAQRGEVRVLGRGQPVLLLHRGRGHPGHVADAAPGVQHGHVVGDELERVPVAGHDQHVHAVRGALGGERGDDVVGLVAGHRHPPDAERVEHLEDQAELGAEIRGRLGPVRLVVHVLLVPERRLAPVEGHRDVRRVLVPQHVDEHRGEAVHGVRRLPGGGGEVLRRQREKGPVGQRVPVDEQQPVPRGRRAGRRGRGLGSHLSILGCLLRQAGGLPPKPGGVPPERRWP